MKGRLCIEGENDMKYESTRGSQQFMNAPQAIIRGIAEDKGLYVPAQIPQLPASPEELAKLTYQDIAYKVIGAFFDDFTEDELSACIDGAYDEKFEAEEIVPIVEAGGAHFLELYHGKTAAFKDMALSILPYLMTTSLKKEGVTDKICILTATSGDTGKAALEGFAGVEGTEIVVFYPYGAVSQVQERQMTSQEGANTHVFAIKGNFDNAQTGVKQIFNDDAFAAQLAERGIRLSSANSINIGRLVPQVAYYVYGYVKLLGRGVVKAGEPVNIVVPTGNFGNILAAYLAAEMGIPVNKFICASNENKVLTDFINTGVYDIRRDFFVTNSPSMDILISSNLERLLYLLSGRDGEAVKGWMGQLDAEKIYEVSDEVKEGMKCFYGGFCTEAETEAAVGDMYEKHGYLMDTHTAVAYKVYQDYVAATGDNAPMVVLSTASPYKFPAAVLSSLEDVPQMDEFQQMERLEAVSGVKIPANLSGLQQKKELHTGVIEKTAMLDFVMGL